MTTHQKIGMSVLALIALAGFCLAGYWDKQYIMQKYNTCTLLNDNYQAIQSCVADE